MSKQRIQITLDPKVYALIKNSQANKSQYIENLIVEDFQRKNRQGIVESVMQRLLEDAEWQEKLKYALSSIKPEQTKDDITYTNDWGA